MMDEDQGEARAGSQAGCASMREPSPKSAVDWRNDGAQKQTEEFYQARYEEIDPLFTNRAFQQWPDQKN